MGSLAEVEIFGWSFRVEAWKIETEELSEAWGVRFERTGHASALIVRSSDFLACALADLPLVSPIQTRPFLVSFIASSSVSTVDIDIVR